MKIFLIGFMGAGKSSLGKKLAARLGLSFLDTDSFLESKQGRTITEIFEQEGEGYFRKLEAEYLRELADIERVVVATGGGLPCYQQNMDWMNEQGVTIYLEVPEDVLVNRVLTDNNKRPLLQGKSADQLSEYVKGTLAKRNKYYYQAQFVCHAAHPMDELVDVLAGYFRRFYVSSFQNEADSPG